MRIETSFLGKKFYFSASNPADAEKLERKIKEAKRKLKAAAVENFSSTVKELFNENRESAPLVRRRAPEPEFKPLPPMVKLPEPEFKPLPPMVKRPEVRWLGPNNNGGVSSCTVEEYRQMLIAKNTVVNPQPVIRRPEPVEVVNADDYITEKHKSLPVAEKIDPDTVELNGKEINLDGYTSSYSVDIDEDYLYWMDKETNLFMFKTEL